MKISIRRRLAAGKRRIEKRLDKGNCQGCDRPMLRPANIQYELAERTRGMTYGGIGSMLLLVRKLGLAEAIDRRLHLLKIHLPYHESDHVLNLAFNALCDGDLPGRSRTAPQRRSVSRRRQCPAHSRSHHGRRLLPPLPAPRRAHAARRVQRDAAQSLGSAARRRSSTKPASTWTARWCPPRASASRGWTSPTRATGVIIRWW